MFSLIKSNPENPGFLLRCTHPTHGVCMVHVGDGSHESIRRAMERCGTLPLSVGNPGVESIVGSTGALGGVEDCAELPSEVEFL